MNWRRIKIGLLILLGLLLIIPGLLYLNAIDLSKSHQARVNALPLFSSTQDRGEFRLAANNLEFLVRVAGMQNKGPALLLLHGFPESSIMWQPLLDAAAAKGFRAVAFDQRGYSPNARPKKVEAYEIDYLVQDVLAVAEKIGFDTFHLVGHDWGSAVGWKTTMDFPEKIHTWTALSIPHIGVFFNGILNDPEQQQRSAYMQKLRTPILPELLFQLNREKFFKRVEGIWQPNEIAEYKAIHSEHGATTAALNWYRALDNKKIAAEDLLNPKIIRPTLFIWGVNDGVVAPKSVSEQAPYIDAPFQVLQLESGHSLMQENRDSVVQAIFAHIDKFDANQVQ